MDTLEIDYVVNGSPLVLNEQFFEVSNQDCDPSTINYKAETDAQNITISIEKAGGSITVLSSDRLLIEQYPDGLDFRVFAETLRD